MNTQKKQIGKKKIKEATDETVSFLSHTKYLEFLLASVFTSENNVDKLICMPGYVQFVNCISHTILSYYATPCTDYF